eukprot:2380408-Prymnesium_polylepis.1
MHSSAPSRNHMYSPRSLAHMANVTTTSARPTCSHVFRSSRFRCGRAVFLRATLLDHEVVV